MMTRHLLWKDAMTIKPLVAAILIGIVAAYAVLALAASSLGTTESANFFVSFWILMPNLVALGAPAMLIGGEEENGTLNWLRSLPVSWNKVADSKFVVALTSLVIAWIASSLLLLISTQSLAINLRPWSPGTSAAARGTAFMQDVLSPSGISYLFFFSILLLLCGFVTAYLFRSPIAGLIAVIPLISIVNVYAMEVGRFMLTGRFDHSGSITNVSASSYLSVVLAGIALLLAFWFLQRIAACRRLTSPQSNRLKKFSPAESESAYRPPRMVGTTARPSPSSALHWQQFRQMAIPGFALTILICGFIFSAHSNAYRGIVGFLRDIAPLVIAVGASWLGGLAFYGDNVRGRRAFFADRGISATRIWWSRILIPCLGFLVVSVVALLARSADRRPDMGEGIFVVIAVTFSIGQLIGQWMRRPVLTFFAGPAYSAIVLIGFLALFSWYPSFYWTALLAVPVLLFASWRLTGRWITGRVDVGYHWRAFVYSALALGIPILAVTTSRIVTTPDAIPDFRTRMLAIETPEFETHPSGRLAHMTSIVPGTFSIAGHSPVFERASTEEKREALQAELASDRIGSFVSLDEINAVLGNTAENPALQRTAVAVLLKWARQVRTGVLEGNNILWDLDLAAEAAESRAVDALDDLVRLHGPTPELRTLVDQIPDRQLRQQSRRIALAAEWKAYDQMDWKYEFPNQSEYGKIFALHPVARNVSRLPFERTRADRYIDKLTQLLLNQLDHRLPDTAAWYSERDDLWGEATAPPNPHLPNQIPVTRNWTQEYENRIDRLRAKFVRSESFR